MPTYEYECNDCSHHFEKFQKMTDEPIKVCPKCNGNVKRLINSGAGLIFKGSGFYVTDYKRKNVGSCGCSNSGKCDMKNKSEGQKSCQDKNG